MTQGSKLNLLQIYASWVCVECHDIIVMLRDRLVYDKQPSTVVIQNDSGFLGNHCNLNIMQIHEKRS